jgi:ferrous iron transport protein A
MAIATLTLEDLPVAGQARVADVVGDDRLAIRLLEMGITPGTVVRVLGRAPFGDPLEIEVRGYRLSIRRAEAARVKLAPD